MKTPTIIAALALILTGCKSLETNFAANADTTKLKNFYVEKFSLDKRGIERVISDQITLAGKSASYGSINSMPADTDALVTYQDRWQWDITMYMLELNIQIRDPKSKALIASGKSYRPSLQRESPENMAKEILNKLLKNEKATAQPES